MIPKLQSSSSLSRILPFDVYYKAVHGTVSQNEAVQNHLQEKRLNDLQSFRLSKIAVIPFIGSTLLAIGASTTRVLDRFSEPVKKFIQSALTFLSLSLGTITAIDFFKESEDGFYSESDDFVNKLSGVES